MKTAQDRENILTFLASNGYDVPDYGTVAELYHCGGHGDGNCIVYSEDGHKEKTTLHRAVQNRPNDIVVMYVTSSMWLSTHISHSTKMIQIGCRSYWYDYYNEKSWEATQGVPELKMQLAGYCGQLKEPIFSIDFVTDYSGKIYAVDFDRTPKIRSTDLINRISRKEIVGLIREGEKYYEQKRRI